MNRSAHRILVALPAAALLLVGCSGSDASSSARPSEDDAATAAPASDFGRVVALGEEFLLADLLALGVEPVASTATVADVGFQGLGDLDTEGIEALPSDEPNIERLASFRPDTIVASQFVEDEIGADTLSSLAERVVVVPDGGGEGSVEAIGEQLGLEEEADALLGELAAAREAAAGTAPDGCTISLATIYPGPAPAAWIGGPNNVALALEDLGCELSPGPDDLDPDPTSRTAGRVFLSLERLGVLDAPQLILLQSDTVEGEAETLADLEDDPLWQQLPAVEAGAVDELDRLGYAGVPGQIRLYADLTELVGAS